MAAGPIRKRGRRTGAALLVEVEMSVDSMAISRRALLKGVSAMALVPAVWSVAADEAVAQDADVTSVRVLSVEDPSTSP